MIKYKNYIIKKHDDKNWLVTKVVTKIAPRDLTNPGTGDLAHAEGEPYEVTNRVGFYSDVGAALSGVVKDLAGEGCKTLKDLAAQIAGIKKDLHKLLEAT